MFSLSQLAAIAQGVHKARGPADGRGCRSVLTIYTRALLGFQRRRGRRRGVVDGRSGTVTAIQRFGGGPQVNVHFHTLVLDGVFAIAPDGTAHFDPAPPPTDREVARLLAAIRTRILRLLQRRGVLAADETADLEADVGDHRET